MDTDLKTIIDLEDLDENIISNIVNIDHTCTPLENIGMDMDYIYKIVSRDISTGSVEMSRADSRYTDVLDSYTFLDNDTTLDCRVPNNIVMAADIQEMVNKDIPNSIETKSVNFEKIQIICTNSELYSRLEKYRHIYNPVSNPESKVDCRSVYSEDNTYNNMHHLSRTHHLWRYVYPYIDVLIDSYILVVYPRSTTSIFALRGRDDRIFKYMLLLNKTEYKNHVGICSPKESDYLNGRHGNYDRSITILNHSSWLKVLARDMHNIFNQSSDTIYIFTIVMKLDLN